MDELGVDQAIVYPTLFNEYLPQVTDLDAAVVLARAYNDWVWELAAQGDAFRPRDSGRPSSGLPSTRSMSRRSRTVAR
jgi:hypothetical protein